MLIVSLSYEVSKHDVISKFYNVYQFSDALCTGTGKIKLENIKDTTEGYIGSFGIISKNNNLLNPDFYNNFMEVDITKYVGAKTNNVTCENVSVVAKSSE